ncbi:RES family NAD+ phosphorylase [Catalinimonas sp. 4WD22]|uniref:RES family NAD+ phosphorylase n=1 Tax=Catalinimonas locisalis TaxID=3133978 RepID=UPI003100B9E2
MITIFRVEKKYKDVWPPMDALYVERRWTKRGFWIIYCSASVSLAKLETLANSKSFPKNRVLLEISIDSKAPIQEISSDDLPKNWMDTPYPKELQEIAEKALIHGKYVGLKVPSRQSPREYNYLLYPQHPKFSSYVKVLDVVDL